jgi:tetratricopeptide (TPR) repeat protein
VSAIERFRSYLDSNPGDRFALYSLALALNKAGRPDDAVPVFAELLQHHPHSGAGHLQLGMLHHKAKRYAQAQAAWEAGLSSLQGVGGPDARKARTEIQAALDDLEDLLDDLD